MIACHFANSVAKQLLVAFLVAELRNQLVPWYARILADSNVADAPSKLEIKKLLADKVPVEVDPTAIWNQVSCLYEKWGRELAAKDSHCPKRSVSLNERLLK